MDKSLAEILQRLVALEVKVTILMAAYGLTIASVILYGMKKLLNGKKNGG